MEREQLSRDWKNIQGMGVIACWWDMTKCSEKKEVWNAPDLKEKQDQVAVLPGFLRSGHVDSGTIKFCPTCLLPLLVHFYSSHIISPLVRQWFSYLSAFVLSCCSVIKLYPTFCNPKDCSILGFSVLHYLLGFVQTHLHCVSNTI